MKKTFFILILTLINQVYGQTLHEITLSKDTPETHLCSWKKGDYETLIEIDSLIKKLKNEQADYSKFKEYAYTDSLSSLFYNQMIARYMVAIEQLEKAQTNFDLKNIVLYYGLEDIERNKESSSIIEENVKRLIQNGSAIIYYKGERIYSLKSNTILIGDEILNRRYETRIFFDNPENCISISYYNLGW